MICYVNREQGSASHDIDEEQTCHLVIIVDLYLPLSFSLSLSL